MPELPEVETIVSELKENHLIGESLLSSSISFSKVLQGISEKEFNSSVKSAKIKDVYRRGKWIVLSLEGFKLHIHLRMTGKLRLCEPDEHVHKHERARFLLKSKKVLIFEDQRKFGRIIYSENLDPLLNLGIEPFEKRFTAKELASIFLRSKRGIKAFLLDQTKIAGLGNIYVDEALFDAKIHPLTPTSHLNLEEIEILRKSILLVLKRGIENSGTTLGNHRSNYSTSKGKKGGNQNKLLVFRKENTPCPNCGTDIIKIKAATRGTHLCPNCQKIR